MTSGKLTSNLSTAEIAMARSILGGRQPYTIYFNAALRDLARGLDNRRFVLGDHGLVMIIDFAEMRVISTVGQVDLEVLQGIARSSSRAEFHVAALEADALLAACGDRVVRNHCLKYYALEMTEPFRVDLNHLRLLDTKDLVQVARFYFDNYPTTIFSEWMLTQPFWGSFAREALVSAGGAVVVDPLSRAANIGNFLTDLSHRRKGHGTRVAMALINDLFHQGIRLFTLGTTEENVAAWKTYESLGFKLLERRTELELRST